MSRYFNKYYNYDGIELWDAEAWKGFENKLNPLLDHLCAIDSKRTPGEDRYAHRTDAVQPATSRCAYYEDILQAWAEQGVVFSCVGMAGLSMAPKAVAEHKKRDAKVLWLPQCVNQRDKNWAMNVIEDNRDIIEKAAKEGVLVQFVPMSMPGRYEPFVEKGIESSGFFRIDYDPVYLDLRILERAGVKLHELEGITELGYGEVTELLGIPVVEITDKWQSATAHQFSISRMYLRMHPNWDYEMHRHSLMGKLQAEGMALEHDYPSADDRALIAKWDKMGLEYASHFHANGDQWVTLTPKCAFESDEKIPCLVIMKEPRPCIPSALLTAMQFYREFIEIAAHGEFMVLFYAMEHPDHNEPLVDILKEAESRYPIDTGRIYITGQSHNGYYALEFYRRHADIIAAAATLCDPIGLEVGAQLHYEDSIADSFARHEMPLININGQIENKFFTAEPGSAQEKHNAHIFRRRLKAFNCPDRSEEEIIAARTQGDYVSRSNGIPADRTEVRYIMGRECYISDIQNNDGKWWLRFATIENLPHMIVPQMAELAWSFIRRFARDTETGKTIERF